MRNLVVETSRGTVVFRYAGWSEKPIAVMFHGFLRSAEDLAAWSERLPDHNLLFAVLPWHNAPDIEGGLPGYVEAFAEAFRGFPAATDLVIGESLGALIAMGTPGRRVVAVDPFLTTAKLWPVHVMVRDRRKANPQAARSYEVIFDRKDHRFILDRITSPTLVIGGDEPLMPPRFMPAPPSLLDEEDFAAFAAHSPGDGPAHRRRSRPAAPDAGPLPGPDPGARRRLASGVESIENAADLAIGGVLSFRIAAQAATGAP